MSDDDRTIVWLRGEHDLSTVAELSDTMARAIAVDDADLVVDLSGVEFMDAGTVGLMIRARNFLRLRSRSLVVRSPSRCARRILVLCGLWDLVDVHPGEVTRSTGLRALGTWVEVPATDRADQIADGPAPDPRNAREPARVAGREGA